MENERMTEEVRSMENIVKDQIESQGMSHNKDIILMVYKQLRITLDFDKIIVRKTSENGDVNFEIKQMAEVVGNPDHADDEILILMQTDSGSNKLYFIKNSKYGTSGEQVDSLHLMKYMRVAVEYIRREYGTNPQIHTLLEEPTISIIPDVYSLTTIENVKKAFSNYINSYLPVLNETLKNTVGMGGERNTKYVYGREFFRALEGEYKIPIWTTSKEDPFKEIKAEILKKITDVNVNLYNLGIDTNLVKFLNFYDRYVGSVQYRVKFFTNKNYLQQEATWNTLGVGMMKLNKITSISSMVDYIDLI